MPTTRERIIDVIQGIDSENVLEKLLSVIQEEVEKQAAKPQKEPDVSKFSREQLLDFIRSKTGGELHGTVTKFEDPFDSPLTESEWELDKEL
jgi:hypothetical protein